MDESIIRGRAESRSGRLAAAVRADAARNRLPRELNRSWLDRARPFDDSLSLGSDGAAAVEALLDDLLGGCRIKRRDKWLEALDVVLANLVDAERRPKHPVSVSRTDADWDGRNRLSHVIELTDLLAERGYIGMKMGYHYDDESRSTRIWSLPYLLRTHRELHCSCVIVRPPKEPVELYSLRATKHDKRRLIDYKDTEFTCRTRRRLQRANAVNGAAVIELDDGWDHQIVTSYIKAIYIGNFSLYGRLHTYGGRHVQALSESERESLTINGESVVEKDFSALHPRLLYAAEGVEYAGDPYTAVMRELIGPEPTIGRERKAPPELRDFLKTALLALLNSKDFTSAQAAANYWLYQRGGSIRKLGITRARPVLEAFYTAHSTIAHHFCNGKINGLRVMNRDSQMALDIVSHFARQNIPILPIHDSFIVQKRHEKELVETMNSTYKKHNSGLSCPIK